MRCCNKLIKPRRYTFEEDGKKFVIKLGNCINPKCRLLILEIEEISIFGRCKKKTLKGKKAKAFWEEKEAKIFFNPKHKQYKKNTAKGFNYLDGREQAIKELSTDRKVDSFKENARTYRIPEPELEIIKT